MIFWTIYISLALYVLALSLLMSSRDEPARRLARLAWTAAFSLYILHVLAAYHYQHRWSQADALSHAAKRTAEVVGLDWSGGLYVNYVFTIVWFADVAWWWRNAEAYRRRPRWMTFSIHAFFAFIAINSTVVFARGAVRWISAAAAAALVVLWFSQRKNKLPRSALTRT